MIFLKGALLLCLVGLTHSMNLNKAKHENVLYFQAHEENTDAEAVTCNDGSQCPDGNTCCQLASGQYGCCPLVQATCCDDHVHCCPNGYKCDLTAGTCVRGDHVISIFTKQPAKNPPKKLILIEKSEENILAESVVCPGGQSQCPDGTTCCRMQSGDFGCCLYPKAVCCSDGLHCCPNGYRCDVSQGECKRGADSIQWVEKVLAKTRVEVTCNDGSSCPTGSTCCQLASGGYGCCPLPQAVCCDDHVHCCPNGYTCDVSAGTCNRGNDIVSWLTKQPAKKIVGDVPCDDTSSCPDGNTCCLLASRQYGCCPLPKAVCCDDHVHCCPNGYTCDVSAGTCNRGNDIVSWLTKQPSKKIVGDVPCDDTSSCPDGNTCCLLASGQYGCCPLPKAVCCDDHVHCCPNGYTCDVSAGTCNRGSDLVSWFTKQPAKSLL